MKTWFKANSVAIALAMISFGGAYVASQKTNAVEFSDMKRSIEIVQKVQAEDKATLKSREAHINRQEILIVEFNQVRGKVDSMMPMYEKLTNIMHSIDKTLSSAQVREENLTNAVNEIRESQKTMKYDIQQIKVDLAKKN